MRIAVIFRGGQIGHIEPFTLDHLLQEDDVVAFRRSTGWVQVGRDVLRRSQERFFGPRKRRSDGIPDVRFAFPFTVR